MYKVGLARLRREYDVMQKESIPNAIAIPDPKIGIDGIM